MIKVAKIINEVAHMSTWQISGEYMESCNCDYLCPCIYTNPQGEVTHDHCYAMMLYHIEQGQHGDVDLAGRTFAFVIRSGKVMAGGNWIFAGVIDEQASDAQRAALALIVSGEAGGTPGMIRDNLVSDFRGIAFKPMSFSIDGLKRVAAVTDVFDFEIDGVPSRNNSGDPYYLDNTSHPANTRLALARTSSLNVAGFGLSLTMSGQGNNGHFAPFSWAN
ncbi:MAG: hypothetical protein ACI8W7_000880 [Gammaproteobacteria bacterium]